MNVKTNKKQTRQYYIDWLRIFLILTVFLFHIGMLFNNFDWHVKNEQQFPGLAPVMSFLHLWRMPLLFLISGAGTFFALGKRTGWQYLKERFNRLVIPLIAGIFILVPVQVYFERIDQYESLLHYYPNMFKGVYPEGNFSWHHLWFIAYLFLISLIISPFLKYFKSRNFRRFKLTLEKIVRQPGGMNLIIIPLLASQILLKPYFPKETHDLVNDWAFITFNLIFFLAGFILFVNPRIIHQLRKQKRLYLYETLLFSVAFFILRSVPDEPFIIHEFVSTGLAWICGVTVLAYASKHLNINTPLRKLANEAIYPFYLLHQPIIIIYGYYITQWDIHVMGKVLFITFLSFSTSIFIYWILIRPFNFMRILFGMKKIKAPEKEGVTKPKENYHLHEGRKIAIAESPDR